MAQQKLAQQKIQRQFQRQPKIKPNYGTKAGGMFMKRNYIQKIESATHCSFGTPNYLHVPCTPRVQRSNFKLGSAKEASAQVRKPNNQQNPKAIQQKDSKQQEILIKAKLLSIKEQESSSQSKTRQKSMRNSKSVGKDKSSSSKNGQSRKNGLSQTLKNLETSKNGGSKNQTLEKSPVTLQK